MTMKKWIALCLVVLLLPVSAFASSPTVVMSQDYVIYRRISRNTAKTLDNMPEKARARTDSLIIGVPDLMGELNPFWVRTTGDNYAVSLLYDELVFASNDGAVGDGVASFTRSADGRTYTFTIKDGVKYTDGMPVTSDDFINALYLLLMPGYDGAYDISGAGIVGVDAYLNGEADAISGIVRENDKRFSVTLASANSNQLIHLAIPALRTALFGEMRRPEGLAGFDAFLSYYDETLARVRGVDASQMAYGQYLLTSMEKGGKAVLVKNEAYWRGVPYIGTVELQVVPLGDELQAILDGDIDIISMLGSVDAVDMVVDLGNGFINLYTWDGDVVGYLGMDLENLLFADVRVRQALAVGFDRDTARRNMIERYGNVPGTLLFDSFDAGTARVLGEQYAFDTERAAQLLADAGWRVDDDGVLRRDGEPFAFTLVYNTPNPVMEATFSQMQADYALLGIEATAEPVSFEALLERVDAGEYEMYFQSRRLPHSPLVATDFFGGESHLNAGLYEDEMAERLLEMAAVESDPSRQMLIYEMYFQQLYMDLPFIPLYRRSEFLLVNARVMNATVTTAHDITSDLYRFFLTDTLEGQW